ncbi:UNVERIFIED_CONTAM: universal stress protein [Kocuria sp. CPCC 205316]|uniref:universal stress protein n=1 Tax=Kocuria TaxID=57493 RepID=UPI0036D846C4
MTAAGVPRYVVGCSGDRRSRDAVRLGAALARDLGAELEIVLVLRADDPYQQVYPPVGDISTVLRRQAHQWLREAAALVPEGITARTCVREARSVPAGLVEAAAELGAAMIVVGAGTGGGRFTLGSVVNSLLHSSPVPVALAPRRCSGDERLTRLYAAVGTRPGAHQVIREAAEAVERSGLELELISFLEDEAADPDATEQIRRRVEDHLEAAAAEARRSGPVTVRVVSGRTLKKAAQDVDWAPGGLLLIGSSRLAQGRQTFLGTTAARLLKHIPVPMVVVPRSAPDADQARTEKETAS